MKEWFCYDGTGECGSWEAMEYFDSEADALEHARKRLEDYRDADGSWGIDEAQIASIVVGRITHHAVLHTSIQSRETLERDDNGVEVGEELWEVRIEPVEAS